MLRVFRVMSGVNLRLVHLKHSIPTFAPTHICGFVKNPNVERWVIKWGGVAGITSTSDDGKFLQVKHFLRGRCKSLPLFLYLSLRSGEVSCLRVHWVKFRPRCDKVHGISSVQVNNQANPLGITLPVRLFNGGGVEVNGDHLAVNRGGVERRTG